MRLWIERNGDNNQQTWRKRDGWGKVFKLTEHNQRLHKSAELLGFKMPFSVKKLDAATIELLKRQGFPDVYVRPIA